MYAEIGSWGSLVKGDCRCSGAAGSKSVTKCGIVVFERERDGGDGTQNIMRIRILRGSNAHGEEEAATDTVAKIDSPARMVRATGAMEILRG